MKDYVFKKDGKLITAVSAINVSEAYELIYNTFPSNIVDQVEEADIVVLEDSRITELEDKVEFLMEQHSQRNGVDSSTLKELYEQSKK